MHDAVAAPLAGWESFYVIVGSSAAALTGLMFVVITLIADTGPRPQTSALAAFGTPTIVHFCAALLVSATLSAPWRRLPSAGVALGVLGAAGLVYCVIVLRRALTATGYKPVLEDWVWHTILPFLAYGSVFVAGVVLARWVESALFAVGGATLLLVFIGIHNAWDTVTYIAIEEADKRKRRGGRERDHGARKTDATQPP